MLELFENQDGARLGHHETVTVGVEGPARGRRFVVSAREGAHGCVASDPGGGYCGVGAAAEHHLGPSEPDRVEAFADRHLGGRTGGAL